MSRQLILLLFLFIILQSAGQSQIKTRGKILDAHSGLPVRSAAIISSENNYGTTSDSSGLFSIVVSPGIPVFISCIGYQTISVNFGSDTAIKTILLNPNYTAENEVFIIGSRGRPRSDFNSPVPVDIINSKELINTGQVDLAQMAQFTSPSFVSVKTGLNGAANYADPASLKGLSPDQSLVLVNGKRRHQFAAISNTLVPGRGSVVTDLNAIPALALERLEILRDGAAAIYGSDAIAGVINLSLKKNNSGGLLKSDFGITHRGDGLTLATSLNHGFRLGKKDGYLNLTLSIQQIQGTDRSDPYTGTIYNNNRQADDSIRNARGIWPAGLPAYVMKYGSNESSAFQTFANWGLPLQKNWKWYGFGGSSNKYIIAEGFFRTARPSDPNSSPIYPDGYAPQLPGRTADYSLFTGFEKNSSSGWKIDLGTGFGYNHLDWYTLNTSNPSLGGDSPTDFYVGRNAYKQSITELDFSKTLKNIRFLKWINIAFGTQLRYDQYQLSEGDPESYEVGPLALTSNKASGSSGRPGISIQDRSINSRINSGTYLDLETDINDRLMISTAARYEYYNDFGGNLSGKIAGILKINPSLAIRSSINRGFRAPSLQQIYNGQTTSNAQNGIIRQTKQLPANDVRLAAIGIPFPEPELSWNYNSGITFNLGKQFILTLDGFIIDVNNKIIISEILPVGTSIPQLQSVFPVSSGIQEITFFTNHINTQTKGADIVLSYSRDIHKKLKLKLNSAASINKTILKSEKNPPATLISGALIPIKLIDTISISLITNAQPRQKIITSAELSNQNFQLTIRQSYFGSVEAWEKPTGLTHRKQVFRGKMLTDIALSLHLFKKLQLTVGVNNLFNVYPARVNTSYASYTNGQVPFSRSGLQFGFNGSYYFTGLQIKL